GKKEYRAYACKEPLPLGYTYDAFLSREAYEKLSVTEKQQALLQGVVLEHSSLPQVTPVFEDETMAYKVAPGEGCELSEGKIRVTKPGASLKVVFRGLPECETYLVVNGLDYEGLSPRELISEKEWEKMTQYEKNSVLHEESQWRYWKESKEASIGVSTLHANKRLRIFTNKYNAYSGKHNFLCNTGYQSEPCQ
ncbi:bacterial membrane protein YfhO, partial [gut metagenome]